jgi:hypothetical protein
MKRFTVVRLGGHFAEVVNAPMNVGVLFAVVADDAIDDLSRLLRGGGVVEIDERATVAHGSVEDRKIVADAVDVERIGDEGRGAR